MTTLCLSLHAGYRCRHSGACCQNWTVPAEPQVIQLVHARQIRRAGVSGDLFVPSGDHDGAWDVARDRDGRCVFFDRGAGRLCVIHKEAGASALPSACRHFPRKILRDDRGTFISLSHFCPTAAVMLLAPDPLDVVECHPPLRLEEPVEGLDARGALPPLLRPGVLSDLEGYDAWERAAVATFARTDIDYRQALDVVGAASDRVRAWRPGPCTLAEAVAAAFRCAEPDAVADGSTQARAIEAVHALCGDRVPEDIALIDGFDAAWARLVAPSFARFDGAMKNYLAARLFANWIAYQGRGLRSIVEWLRTCAAVVRHHLVRRALDAGSPPAPDDFIEAVRMADLLLLHVVDTQAFARRFAPAEGPDPR